jgi:copper homeostasis protein CutC
VRRGAALSLAGLVKAVRAALTIPVYVLLRPRGGDFLYTPQELLVCVNSWKFLPASSLSTPGNGIRAFICMP